MYDSVTSMNKYSKKLLLVGLALVTGLDFTSIAFTEEKSALLPRLARSAESPGLTTFIFPRNP